MSSVALYQQARTNLHGTVFSYIGHMQDWRICKLYSCLFLHATIVSELYCVHLSQAKFELKRN